MKTTSAKIDETWFNRRAATLLRDSGRYSDVERERGYVAP